MVLFAVFFTRALRKLSRLVETLAEHKQTTSLEAFMTLRRALIAGMCMSVAVSFIQTADFLMNDLAPWTWRYTWFPQDGASRLVFLLSLVGMMMVWWPGVSSRSFGYSLQATNEVDAYHVDQPDRLVLDDMSDAVQEWRHQPPETDDDPLDSPKLTNAVAPEPIGARQEWQHVPPETDDDLQDDPRRTNAVAPEPIRDRRDESKNLK